MPISASTLILCRLLVTRDSTATGLKFREEGTATKVHKLDQLLDAFSRYNGQ
jgi:hypothetical protein